MRVTADASAVRVTRPRTEEDEKDARRPEDDERSTAAGAVAHDGTGDGGVRPGGRHLAGTARICAGSGTGTGSDSVPVLAAVQAQPSRALRADEVTKYYVVKSAQENGGEQETLFGIAQRTLGDGDRFEEILVLNSGRQLPDGSAFVSPDQLTPGFPLILPEDADGAGVEFGVLPEENADAAKPPHGAPPPRPAPRPAGARDRSPGWATGSGRPG